MVPKQSKRVGIMSPSCLMTMHFMFQAPYVPSSPYNLLSINSLTHSLNYVISFTKDSCFRMDNWHQMGVQWPLPTLQPIVIIC